ncbi:MULTISPECIES: tetratricopeptide repeat protein [Planktothrix]|uniref:tetratricopeptide repeat protein n=1 Tax=Planktothrix TaxID=54304 RepID=UPI0004295ED6|nr:MULTISPECIES: tetratricopeptide repeat protein [Planktothrix]
MSDLIRGNQLLRSGKLEEAVAAYKSAITNYPNFHWSHYKLAEALEQLGHLEDAIISYRKAIKLNSNCSWFYYKLGIALLKKGDQELAIANYKKAIEINPHSLQLQSSLAIAIETRLTSNNSINLNPNPDVNLALNKATAQSSVYQPEVYGYDPHGACNGKKTGKFGFHTCQENQPWWQIDLQANYQLAKIKIYNRIGFEKRASALNILLSQDALNWELLYSNDPENLFGGIDGKPLIVDMPYKVARFVQLQLRGIEYLNLDEVEIYGFPVKPDSFESKSNQDEATLSANFYGQDNLPGDISIIQGIIARRVDGLGGRLMSILSARYTCEYLGCNLYVSWPRIVSRYYSSNILNTNSLSEIFEGGKIFKDIDVPWIKEEDFSMLHTQLLSSVNKDFKKSGCFLILNKKQTENIFRYKFLIWDDPWAVVPYDNTLKEVSLKVKDYWKKINWHHQIIDQIQKFKNQVNSRSYLVVHIRRGDIIQRLLYDNIQTLNRDIPTIFGRFLPIKTAVKFVLDSGFKDVVVCSECEDSTQILVDQIKQNNHQINCYITAEFTQSLSETQSAAYDLIIMSDAAKILTSFSSTFSTCAEFVGNTYRAKPLTDWENIDWENMADELMAYLDNNNNEMTNERKSLVYIFISKYVQDQELSSYYMSLSKQY